METIGTLISSSRYTRATRSERPAWKLPQSQREIEERLRTEYRLRVTHISRRDYQDMGDVFGRVAAWLTDTGAKTGLMMTGGVGTGKSTLLYAIRRVVNDCGYTGKMFLASDFRTLFLDNAEQTSRQVLGGDWCRYLYLDDVGTDPRTLRDFGNEIRPFVRIVEARYNNGLPLVFTTNIAPEGIAQEYDLRTADRLREMCEVITFNRGSYRQ